MKFLKIILFTLFASSLSGNSVLSADLAKNLFGAKTKGSLGSADPIGSYAKGCAAGLIQLPETGDSWQAMRLSRNRNWGHPDLIESVKKWSTKAKSYGWGGLYIGDISQPRGGPMLTGHKSHQIGLDVDIWLKPKAYTFLSISERETVPPISMSKSGGALVNHNWTETHHKVLREISKDERVARIFIFPGAKVKMCREEKGDKNWLRKVRPWWGHNYHIHIRLKCPDDAYTCQDQYPPPIGDGCTHAENWVRKIFNPPPLTRKRPIFRPRPELILSDLPKSCVSVLNDE